MLDLIFFFFQRGEMSRYVPWSINTEAKLRVNVISEIAYGSASLVNYSLVFSLNNLVVFYFHEAENFLVFLFINLLVPFIYISLNAYCFYWNFFNIFHYRSKYLITLKQSDRKVKRIKYLLKNNRFYQYEEFNFVEKIQQYHAASFFT